MSLTFGILLAASVAVDLSGIPADAQARLDTDRLHGRLVVRLAEEGFAVRAASAPASYRLELSLSPAGNAVLRVVGERERREDIPAAPRPVFHLELIQRALVLLDQVPPAPTRSPPLPRVFVRFPSRADRETANRLYERAAVGVIEEGYELVGSIERADRLVCISSAGAPVWLAPGAGCDPPRAPASKSRTVAAAPERAPALPAAMPSPRREGQPASTDRSAKSMTLAAIDAPASSPVPRRIEREADPSESGSIGLMLGTSAGLVARGDGVDPSSALWLRIGGDRGFCAVLTGRVTPVDGHGFDLIETSAAAGPGWRFGLRRITLEASLLGGLLRQRYQRWGEPADLVRSWLFVAPIDLSLRLGRSWRLHGAILPSLTKEERFFPGPWEGRRAPNTTEGWANGAFQLAFDAGLSFTF
jgi:hypothetical protein